MSTSSKCPFQGHDLISLPERLGSVLFFLDSSKLLFSSKSLHGKNLPRVFFRKKLLLALKGKKSDGLCMLCVCASRDFPVKVSRVKESGRQHLPAPHRRVLPLLRPVRLRVIRGMDQ